MKQKDISEKKLESHNKVFADIVNAFFAMNGISDRVNPDDLYDAQARTDYKASDDDELRDQERDVVKLWKTPTGEAVICLVGLENQTRVDPYMPLRIIGYEGADYRGQLPLKKGKANKRPNKPHFVLTIVLYFGIKRRWPKKRSLHERLKVPAEYRSVVNDCKVNVIELAWLSPEQEKLFKSEFFIFAHYLGQVRRGEKPQFSPELAVAIEHVTDFLDVCKALMKRHEYDYIISNLQAKYKEEENMESMGLPNIFEDVLDEGIAIGEARGISIGRDEGIAIGEARGISIGRDEGIAIGEARGISIGEARGISIGRDEVCASLRSQLIVGGMSPQEADRYIQLALANLNLSNQ
ncbi:MAG: Rpn family recombination-promoting nuclease/putative transposase [Synergistaceae bacterium]|nr:Rpn family recombination-promoting nuclease/putative transposase [Synergistaceae bacterium]